MKKLLLAAVIILSGCTAIPAKLEIAGLERSENVRITDLRPASERTAEVFSSFDFHKGFGIKRLDDAALTPSPLRVLQHRAYEKLKGQNDNLDLKVHHLVIYRNQQNFRRQGGMAAHLGGIVGTAIILHQMNKPSISPTSLPVVESEFSAADVPEYMRATVDGKETAMQHGLHAVYIETESNGQRVFTKTLRPIRRNDVNLSLRIVVEDAINYHLSQYKVGANTQP